MQGTIPYDLKGVVNSGGDDNSWDFAWWYLIPWKV